MNQEQLRTIFLADDDLDDCFLFEEALGEISVAIQLTTAHDGVELMTLLSNTEDLPQILFLDLNMPKKNGFQCLEEIKASETLRILDVVILSTSLSPEIADRLLTMGAKRYLQKPNDLSVLRRFIHETLAITDVNVLANNS